MRSTLRIGWRRREGAVALHSVRVGEFVASVELHEVRIGAVMFVKGDRVRVVGESAPSWMFGEVGVVREWDGSVYHVVVQNRAGFPWIVELSPVEVEGL